MWASATRSNLAQLARCGLFRSSLRSLVAKFREFLRSSAASFSENPASVYAPELSAGLHFWYLQLAVVR